MGIYRFYQFYHFREITGAAILSDLPISRPRLFYQFIILARLPASPFCHYSFFAALPVSSLRAYQFFHFWRFCHFSELPGPIVLPLCQISRPCRFSPFSFYQFYHFTHFTIFRAPVGRPIFAILPSPPNCAALLIFPDGPFFWARRPLRVG